MLHRRTLRIAQFGRRTVCVSLIVLTLGATSLLATPMCEPDTYANYIAQGQCTIGPAGIFTLQGFSFASSSIPTQGGPGAPTLLDPSQINVSLNAESSSIALQFTPSGGFNVGAGQFAEYIFRYQIDPPPPVIGDQTIDLGPDDPVTLTGEFCGNGTLTSAPNTVPVTCTGSNPAGIFPGTVSLTGPSAAPRTADFIFPIRVSTEDVRLILDLDGRNTTTGAHADYIGSTTGFTSGIPEPATAMLVLAGILCLVLIGRPMTRSKSAPPDSRMGSDFFKIPDTSEVQR